MNNIEGLIVAKFGGSSLANAEGFMQVSNIIKGDPRRRVIVPSAPGVVRNNSLGLEDNVKITDLLIACGQLSFRSFSSNSIFGVIERRFLQIAYGLEVCINEDLKEIREGLLIKRENEEYSVEWAASRGEWLSGKILARYLGAEFVDAAEIMKFQDDGTFDIEESYRLINQRLHGLGRFVVPGFYGSDRMGRIRTFPRGGSDITGSYLSVALNAELYENWTDTNGVLTADPKLVPQATTIPHLLYEEMAELGRLGARVFHVLALDPVWARGILVNVRNTFNTEHRGTFIGDQRLLEGLI